MLNIVDKVRGTNRTDLARQIQSTVRNFTHGRPMPQDEVIAVMAFCAGVAIGNQPPEVDRRHLMAMCGNMLAEGEEAARKGRETNVVNLEAIRKS